MFHKTLSYIMSWLVPNIRLDKFDVSHASLRHEEKKVRGSSHWLARLAWHDPHSQSLESGLLTASESSTYYSKTLDELTP